MTNKKESLILQSQFIGDSCLWYVDGVESYGVARLVGQLVHALIEQDTVGLREGPLKRLCAVLVPRRVCAMVTHISVPRTRQGFVPGLKVEEHGCVGPQFGVVGLFPPHCGVMSRTDFVDFLNMNQVYSI